VSLINACRVPKTPTAALDDGGIFQERKRAPFPRIV
jgi:hypothetical protein